MRLDRSRSLSFASFSKVKYKNNSIELKSHPPNNVRLHLLLNEINQVAFKELTGKDFIDASHYLSMRILIQTFGLISMMTHEPIMDIFGEPR